MFYIIISIKMEWPINVSNDNSNELNLIVGNLSDEKRNELYLILKQDREKKKQLMLKDFEENHVKIEENMEMFGERWKIIHINLPSVWDFGWFKFDFFVSDRIVWKEDFEGKQLEKQSYSRREVADLLEALNKYMEACWVDWDGEVDYEQYANVYGKRCYDSEAWKFLRKKIKRDYWLSDKNSLDWTIDDGDIRAYLTCWGWECWFFAISADCDVANAQLLFRLPD